MRFRLFLVLVTGFFLAMNVLLWRAEFSGHGPVRNPVSVESVWQKMVLAQDASALHILLDGKKVGYCQWRPDLVQRRRDGGPEDELAPEGLARHVAGYTIDLDGYVLLEDAVRLRFNAGLTLETNFVWREMTVRLNLRPDAWEVHADAATRRFRVRIEEGGQHLERVFRFSDLENPQRIVRRLGGNEWLSALTALGVNANLSAATNLLAALQWQAQRDRLPIGAARLPVYRLQARLLERYQAVCYVSQFGEVLRVELPGGIALVNDSLGNL